MSLEHYEELADDLGEAVCVSWCHGGDRELSIEAVARGFGADPASARPATFGEVAGEAHDIGFDSVAAGRPPTVHPILVGPLGAGWMLVAEENGFEGTRPQTLHRLSSGGGRAYTVFWNVNFDTEAVLAVDGRVAGSFELTGLETLHGADPAALTRYLDGLDFDDDALDVKAAALLVGERICGQRLHRSWFRGRYVRYLVNEQPGE